MAQGGQSGNFGFLAEHDPVFFQLASTAEQVFSSDPNTTLIKLRQLGEALAQEVAARSGIEVDEATTQADLLFKLNREIALDPIIRNLFHTLRIEGNKAAHQFQTQHGEAMTGLKVARTLAVWFHQSFGTKGARFKAGPFISPKDPSEQLRELQGQIEQLKVDLAATNQQAASSHKLQELVEQEKAEYAALAEQMDEEARTFEALAIEAEVQLKSMQADYEQRLQSMQTQLDKQHSKESVTKTTQKATQHLDLSEEVTRILIDQQLMDAGWETDTQELTFAKGARPEKGKNKAISEWPTVGRQSADYILFAGLTPIAVVEAKRENTNVAGKITQAERYARGFKQLAGFIPAWQMQAWDDGQGGTFEIPFVYSCNGRLFIKQLAEQSGTWFRDVRSPANIKKPLQDFHSPAGLLDRLTRSKDEAESKLREEGFGYLKLRDYQESAIRAVEQTLAADPDRPACLLAMATGTGKTRTIIGLMYRFLKAERFRRILFLVDRTALGQQALDVFDEATLEQNLPLSKIFNINALGDMAAEAETRIQVATVQAMVRRIFQSDNVPTVDEFDCIIVDEAHRGYTLDQEMTEGELAIRDQSQYLSSYRRVLDYFDAFKVGMTATPAKHTTQIFGKPVYTYSYREAVADDWLIDHEPPIRYETLLTKNGIQFEKGQRVSVINSRSGEVDTAELDDELNFEIEAFNRRVVTESFNEVICQALAQEIMPAEDEKMMIFCATDLHADMVKRLLDKAFNELYGESYNEAAVRKITGKSPDVTQLITRFKNERYPSIAITVDLLSTGIDVPKICHVVFMRRVRSRILFEQMLGRATRRCDEIGKTVFKIYDPVDIYSALEDVSTMKPLVKDPDITLDQLVEELKNPASFEAVGSHPERSHAHDVLDAVSQKVMRIMRKAATKAERNPELKQKLGELEQLWDVPPVELHTHLRKEGPEKAAEFLNRNTNFLSQLGQVKALVGSEYLPIISEHEDRLMAREQSYGIAEKPEDYLESFNDFIKHELNESVALSVVVNRPKDLTRAQLKEIKMLLDEHGYSEARLKTAWRNKTNQEIAASIIGYIRQAALGEPLVSFDQRVAHGMQEIYSLHNWTPVQRKWLDRLAKQLTHEVVIDHQFVNNAFATDGGAQQLDKRFDRQLDVVLDTLADSLWSQSG